MIHWYSTVLMEGCFACFYLFGAVPSAYLSRNMWSNQLDVLESIISSVPSYGVRCATSELHYSVNKSLNETARVVIRLYIFM